MAIAGIDLGTTNSLVAIWTDSGPEMLQNAIGETLTPSAISIADDGVVLVGRAAVDRLITHPDRSVASFKRWMGTATSVRLADKVYRAEDLSALVLRSLREDAEAQLKAPIDEAVISVPAYFSDPQRKATLDAARLAGLRVERLVNEPTAAALAHGLETSGDGCFLILDLGGGTFDVSLLHKYDGVMEVRSSAGDSLLGGNDFRDLIVTMLCRQHGQDPAKLSPAEMARLLREAEQIKHRLTDEVECGYQLGGMEGRLSRAEFEAAAAPLIRRLRAPIERAINDSAIDLATIDQVVLVGGATRMPLVRGLAAKLFGRFPLMHPYPDHVIARGAAVQAGLKARHAALDDVIMTDVCPFTLGTTVIDRHAPEGEAMSPIIERNSIVPISRASRYWTVVENQTQLRIDVLQGENLRPSQNIKIGELLATVPKGPIGKEGVEVRYTYDVNGALEVAVTALSTGATQRQVFRNQANLSQAELDERFAALADIKLSPRDQAENHVLIARAERLYAESLGEMRKHIQALIGQFDEKLNNPQLREAAAVREEFRTELARLERSPF